ncbi:hypothetical protein IV203_025090 [Nitzschia inconspicua]|uniref:Uncharacterized protein n=1 Tax=Nitzschia inconspicua TaxID=303405 RepID=A0A9K3K9I3_9STRA|nr:hypothetical protein IV203_025165 [Nitzschia inconspicua]KAG7365649.1 hypothetical protein IV203_025090 [Nitzschia inconspicua]
MKFYYSLLTVLLPTLVAAGVPKPDISVGLNVGHDTNVGTIGGVTPRIQWESEPTIIAGCDVQGGLDVTITDVKETPRTFVWGKLKKSFPDVTLSVRGEMDANARDIVDVNIQASGFGTGIQVTGSADLVTPSVSVDKVQLNKNLDALGGTLSLNPSYDVATRVPDAVVGYSYGPTSMKVDAQRKQLTVSHTFRTKNTISPTVSVGGDFSLSYSRTLADGKLTTTWKPDDSIKVQWSDGSGWDATVVAPLEGYYNTNGGIKVSMKRNIDVPL